MHRLHRSFLVVFTLVGSLLGVGIPEAEAQNVLFLDRVEWENAVADAGLTIVTEEFATDPGANFELAGVEFARTGNHNPVTEEIESGPIGVVNLIDGEPVFGLAADFDVAFGMVATVNLRGVDVLGDFAGAGIFGGNLPAFIGILSSDEIDPSCPGIPCLGGSEILISGQGQVSASSLDNLSVAVVPEPGMAVMIVAGVIALSGLAVRRLP